MIDFAIRALLLVQLIVSCRGLNFTLPSAGSITEDQTSTFVWNASSSDFTATTTDSFVVFLIKPSNGFHCPDTEIPNKLGLNSKNVVEDYIFQQKPVAQNNSLSGQVILHPRNSGAHFLCAYGNATDFGRRNKTVNGTNSRRDEDKPGQRGGFKGGECSGKKSEIGPIVGGIAGGVAVVCILVATFFYRRFRYQRKLNQFHKEHQLLHQAPPPSILASSLTGPNHYSPYGAASPPPGGLRSPGSPRTIRRTSHAPLGFDETMQKSYHFPSVRSSPSSYSVPLPHEPTLQTQHGSGAGASHV
ncbi:hypothetical protein PM082_014936 [Marasmius tenuissimus]|nr:hypothetical protein PM082_014936 [Marasmius tenuissimus]